MRALSANRLFLSSTIIDFCLSFMASMASICRALSKRLMSRWPIAAIRFSSPAKRKIAPRRTSIDGALRAFGTRCRGAGGDVDGALRLSLGNGAHIGAPQGAGDKNKGKHNGKAKAMAIAKAMAKSSMAGRRCAPNAARCCRARQRKPTIFKRF